jgi:hypothetical protein
MKNDRRSSPGLLTVFLAGIVMVSWALPPRAARADLRPEKVFTADAKKTKFYIRDGLITGGDRAVNDVVIKDIRRGKNPAGFERIVIDLEGNRNGEPMAIPRPPYYQISVTPDERRLVFSVWGNPKLGFDSRKVAAAFKSSSVIEGVQLFPRLEDDVWMFVLEMRHEHPVEVFELANPVRIILDIRNK